MRIHTGLTHYEPDLYAHLCELIRPYVKIPGESVEERAERVGEFTRLYSLISEPDEADLFILPFTWNHYAQRGTSASAIAWIDGVRKYGKPILTTTSGDFGVTPPVSDVHVFRSSGYASRRSPHQHALPFFLNDPLKRFYDRLEPTRLPWQAKPRVGFCGQSRGGWLKQAADLGRIVARNAGYRLGLSANEPQSVYPSIRLRQRVLRVIESDERLQANFIKRRRYRGGARTVEVRRQTTQEYHDNIAESDYIVCVRGRGNFSLRIYETLAMGRIPIFIDTDCTLPYDEVIDWRRFVVWVDAAELAHLPDILLAHHAGLDTGSLYAEQMNCRELWLERLSADGYFAHLPELLA